MRATPPDPPWHEVSKASPFKVLADAFLASDAGFSENQGDRVVGASTTLGENVYKCREDDVRGVTWPDHGGTQVDDELRKLLGDPDAESEWLVAVGMRRADAAYDLANQRAASKHLLPDSKDRDWWRVEAGHVIATRIRERTKDVFDQARATPGEIVEAVLPGDHGIEVRVELVEEVDEWWFVVDRAIDAVESRMIDGMLSFGAPDVEWCEVHDSAGFPDWAATSKRAYFGIPGD